MEQKKRRQAKRERREVEQAQREQERQERSVSQKRVVSEQPSLVKSKVVVPRFYGGARRRSFIVPVELADGRRVEVELDASEARVVQEHVRGLEADAGRQVRWLDDIEGAREQIAQEFELMMTVAQEWRQEAQEVGAAEEEFAEYDVSRYVAELSGGDELSVVFRPARSTWDVCADMYFAQAGFGVEYDTESFKRFIEYLLEPWSEGLESIDYSYGPRLVDGGKLPILLTSWGERGLKVDVETMEAAGLEVLLEASLETESVAWQAVCSATERQFGSGPKFKVVSLEPGYWRSS